jgi:heptosyltransferase-2
MTRIVVVLPNWFGETLFATPFLRALRRGRPESWVATLGRPACREVLLHNPRVNAGLEFDETGRHRGLIGKARLIGELRRERFDAAFILRRSLSRTLLLALAGIPSRIGFANPKSGWLLTRRVAPPERPTHKAATYLPLLSAAGIAADDGPCEYVVTEEERRRARALLAAQRLPSGAALAMLHPGANWAHKRWAPERFAALGDRLAREQGCHPLITGGPDDGELAEAVRRRMRESASVLAGQTTLRELAACLEQARLVVSNDTGVLHIAAALGRPLVGLYGPTSPQLTGPRGDRRRTRVLHHADCCPSIPCYAPDRPPHPGMDAISVEEAYEAAKQLLDAGSWTPEAGRDERSDG